MNGVHVEEEWRGVCPSNHDQNTRLKDVQRACTSIPLKERSTLNTILIQHWVTVLLPESKLKTQWFGSITQRFGFTTQQLQMVWALSLNSWGSAPPSQLHNPLLTTTCNSALPNPLQLHLSITTFHLTPFLSNSDKYDAYNFKFQYLYFRLFTCMPSSSSTALASSSTLLRGV